MIVYLQPKTPFSKAIPRSDTLFGAICWAIRLIYGETHLNKLLEKFQENVAPFIVSSLFPYAETSKGEKILFFPRPLLPPSKLKLSSKEDYDKLKKIKKAKYVSQKVFEDVLDGSYSAKEATYPIESNTLITQAEKDKISFLSEFFKPREIAHNTINRLTNATKLFYEPAIFFNKDQTQKIGFYFLIKINSESDNHIKEMLKAALSFLQDKGFGGNSSTGFGQCEIQIEDKLPFQNQDAEPGKFLITLSLMFPNCKDRDHLLNCKADSYAQLERRKGFLESSYLSGQIAQIWKPTLFMLSEGSVFPCDNDRKLYGWLFEDKRKELDFTPRINGLAYTVVIKGVIS